MTLRMVRARSAAPMPLPTLTWSIDTVNAVSQPARSDGTIGHMSSVSSRSAPHGMQSRPRHHRNMKFTASGVTQLAAIVRSPSFSRSSSSTTRTISPRRIRLIASSTVDSDMGVLLMVREGDDHAAAVRLPPFGMDVAAVEVDDPLRDGEAEPRTTVARRSRRVGAVEALEHADLLRLGDTGPFVDDLDDDAVDAAPRAHLHHAATRSVTHSVLEQVCHDLVHAFGITVGGEVGRVDRNRHADPRRLQLLFTHRVREQGFDAERGAFERDGAGFESRKVEKLLDQA